jgi:hypothetical protein
MLDQMDIEAKYTRVEYERRFLVDTDSGWKNLVEPYSKLFEDKYISGTRLRLRTLTIRAQAAVLLSSLKRANRPRLISGRSVEFCFRRTNTRSLTYWKGTGLERSVIITIISTACFQSTYLKASLGVWSFAKPKATIWKT